MGSAASTTQSSSSQGRSKVKIILNSESTNDGNRNSVRRRRVYEESVDSNLSVSIRPNKDSSIARGSRMIEVLPDGDVAQKLLMEKATRDLLMTATEKLLVIDGADIRDELIDMVLGLMKLNIFTKAGITVVKEGDIGSHVFVVESGRLSVSQDGKEIGTLQRGELFGERALLHDCCRAATVTTLEECRLWRLDRPSFKLIQKKAAILTDNVRAQRLSAVPELGALSKERMTQLVARLTITSFREDEELYKEGKCTSKIMLIEEGTVEITGPDSVLNITDAELARVAGVLDPRRQLLEEEEKLNGSDSSAADDEPCPSLDLIISAPSNQQMTRFESSGAGLCPRRMSSEPHKKFGPGSILGLGVLRSRMGSGWKWVDEVTGGVPLVGAVASVTIVAKSNVRVAFFTIHQYDKLFGPTSSFYFFSTKEMTDLLDRTRRQSEQNEAAAQRMSELAQIQEEQGEEIMIDDKVTYTLGYFDKVEMVAQVTLGTIAIGYKHQRSDSAHTSTSEHDLPSEPITPPSEPSNDLPQQSLPPEAGRYVLKMISKAVASRLKQASHVISESQTLRSLKHPFICQMYGKFQTTRELVLVLERVSGGDLWSLMYEPSDASHVTRHGRSLLSLDMMRFYVGSLVLALEHMHQRGMAYRNLKPENVLIDNRGFIRLVGFGLAKKYPFTDAVTGEQMHRSFTFCGTLEYLSPEIVLAVGHDMSVDTWALGILLYELLVGETPFAHIGEMMDSSGRQKKPDGDTEILAAIANVASAGIPFPQPLSEREKNLGIESLLLGLLQPTASERYPMTTVKRSPIQHSAVFRNFSWHSLLDKNMVPPYVPPASSCTHPRSSGGYLVPHEAYTGNPSVFDGF